jgi:hypothetical protein
VSAADWHRLRDLGNQLFEEPRPAAHRSLQGQDRFTTALRAKGQAKRTVLQGLHSRLVHLGVEQGARLAELSTAHTRLAPLVQSTTDSHKVLSELLAAWPDDASDALRTLVQQAEDLRDALADLSEHARTHLKAGTNHPAVGTDVNAHLGALNSRLAGAQAEQPLSRDWIATWNKKGQELIKRLIEQLPPLHPGQSPTVGGVQALAPAPAALRSVLVRARVNPADGAAVSAFLADVRKALAEQGTERISLALVKTEENE